MSVLFILNDAPSAERSLSALRLACALSMQASTYVRIFLMGAAAACASAPRSSGHRPDDPESLIHAVVLRGGDVRVCGSCGEEPQGAPESVVEGTARGSLEELARWIAEADRVLVF